MTRDGATPIPTTTRTTGVHGVPTRGWRAALDVVALAQRWGTWLVAAYLACIVLATTLGLDFDPSLVDAWYRLQRALHPHVRARDLVDAARNVALFAGLGATMALVTRPPAGRRIIVIATLVGLVASTSVETVQLFSHRRFASIIDVATNTLGALLGATVIVLLERRARTDIRGGTLLGVPAWFAAGALWTACVGLAYAPISRQGGTSVWGESPLVRLAAVRALPPINGSGMSYLPDAISFAALGLLVAVAVEDRAGRIRWPQFAAWLSLLAGLVLGMPVLRGLVGVRHDAIAPWVHGVALAGGLLAALTLVPAWRRAVPAAGARSVQVALVGCALLALWNWWPALWVSASSAGLGWRQLVPMLSLYQRDDMASVFLVLQKAGLGALLGACVAGRRASGLDQPGLRAIALVALAVELGQLLVPGRYPDITDVLMVTGGGAVTLTVALRAVAVAAPRRR
ncbi:MAG: VanZ family protein [Gemmatimonadaceae bacterium]|nr:VanZ family protein [Gemmatimonadaceae bacterium]